MLRKKLIERTREENELKKKAETERRQKKKEKDELIKEKKARKKEKMESDGASPASVEFSSSISDEESEELPSETAKGTTN